LSPERLARLEAEPQALQTLLSFHTISNVKGNDYPRSTTGMYYSQQFFPTVNTHIYRHIHTYTHIHKDSHPFPLPLPILSLLLTITSFYTHTHTHTHTYKKTGRQRAG
jgi:hypothetical protein